MVVIFFTQVCHFEFGDNDYGVGYIVFNDANVYYKDMQTNVLSPNALIATRLLVEKLFGRLTFGQYKFTQQTRLPGYTSLIDIWPTDIYQMIFGQNKFAQHP